MINPLPSILKLQSYYLSTIKMSEYNLVEDLIQFGSKSMDLQYSEILGSWAQSHQVSVQDCSNNESTLSNFEECHSEQESTQHNTPPLEFSTEETSKISSIPKMRRIFKQYLKPSRGADSQDSDDQTPVRRQTKHKKRKGDKQDGYPTKNFLPNFKGPHIQYLQSELGFEYVNSFEIIQTIKAKNGISMKDYEALYKTVEFQEAFKLFFKTKVLYRQLMLSRSSMKARKVHMKKLSVFQKAFNEKLFDRIN